MGHGQTLDRIKWGGGVQPSLREAWPRYFPSADLKSTATLMASRREAGRDGGTPSLPSFVL